MITLPVSCLGWHWLSLQQIKIVQHWISTDFSVVLSVVLGQIKIHRDPGNFSSRLRPSFIALWALKRFCDVLVVFYEYNTQLQHRLLGSSWLTTQFMKNKNLEKQHLLYNKVLPAIGEILSGWNITGRQLPPIFWSNWSHIKYDTHQITSHITHHRYIYIYHLYTSLFVHVC